MRIVYDGWPLAFAPDSPAGLHLWELLAHLPPDVQPVLALPAPAAWPESLPPGLEVHLQPVPDSPAGRLNWEQRGLPALGRQLRAELVHLARYTPALLGAAPAVISPAESFVPGEFTGGGLADRVRHAAAAGGMHRVRAVLWPQDLPDPGLPAPIKPLAALVSPDFNPVDPPERSHPVLADLPETYLLSHAPADLPGLLAAWRWAAGSIGELYPLVIFGLPPVAAARLEALAGEVGLRGSLQALPSLPPEAVPPLYRGAAAVAHTGSLPAWGGPARYALACGKPFIAPEAPGLADLVGPAAYLAPPGDWRALGAALLTVVVQEEVAAQLGEAARRRAAAWRGDAFSAGLGNAFRELLR
jgi:hypothetical protein